MDKLDKERNAYLIRLPDRIVKAIQIKANKLGISRNALISCILQEKIDSEQKEQKSQD
jgi:predicted HicB family RNase H-like nuclease